MDRVLAQGVGGFAGRREAARSIESTRKAIDATAIVKQLTLQARRQQRLALAAGTPSATDSTRDISIMHEAAYP